MLTILEKFLFSSVKTFINIREDTVSALKRLGINNIRDLLFYLPVSYQNKTLSPNLTEVRDGEIIQTEIVIESISLPTKSNKPFKITASNNTGSLLLVFFHRPPPFIFNKLKVGTSHIISGKVQFFDHHLQISHPEFIVNPKLAKEIEPIYSLTYLLSNKQLYSYIIKAIDIFEGQCKELEDKEVKDYLDVILQNLKVLHSLCHSRESGNPEKMDPAVKPRDDTIVCLNNAKKHLAAKELIANQISLFNVRTQISRRQGNIFPKAAGTQVNILNELGFELTPYQKQVIEEIELDQSDKVEMMRLLQGDVGSGKTLVALLTMVNVAAAGFQATLMAPTDLLANQHYEFFVKALKNTNIRVGLLTGKILGLARKNIMIQLENGEIEILVGTHALFQEKVSFKKLGYIVIDEQHRFGVQQRLNLINKGVNPDVLVMTATPIPRSLALTMFGDMTISKLQGKPKNRLPIETNIMSTNKIEHIIEAINKKLIVGERIYWICPLIERGEKKEQEEDSLLMDVMNRFNSIENIYQGYTGIIHGKMKNEQKDIIMKQFKEGEIKILVATTVIEVGIDVPEATLIIIENAEQFGLAQLHQLRGRVGRGNLQSYCILLYNPKRLGKVARGRFEIMKQTNDGFYIAEQDLKLRGSGEILGVKQSGEIEFFFADLAEHYDLLLKANKFAEIGSKDNSDFVDFQIELFAKSQVSELV
ncbi:MAG: ATP-dependent DNA helicase RecG [Rickettsia endosymbiont of Ixodes persulcatus]|nr:ATP-dependent DNA helicase RecG [Rickettsia endosymbiont of Ixodes persulcatus]MCZ6902745.1 ATP-dependent DNA helicase RecG [Rickettsia endosymbiont of Ixodes persulcatus]MCZ6908519.1 ATP-dependent DNA helicase RecG [Rickettsia endosymbiont of Ixodes persulcatus]MCZ6910457.1 ATP-dependent DNA helicase RecG [Rickettsia endosymbiont of Ixodes persulcatus]MCZ6914265.1 ATP-dependent DNA helicase RecG [Rickettsia endosymbiont of Ixodes persulcatus]